MIMIYIGGVLTVQLEIIVDGGTITVNTLTATNNHLMYMDMAMYFSLR